MKPSIFNYADYKVFLLNLIESHANRRGLRKALANAIHCQVSHITNVLSGEGHLSAEQAEACGRFFGLSYDEIDFFLVLIQFNRAGTDDFKKFCDKQLREKRKKFGELKARLKIPDTLSPDKEAIYYSCWEYSAIHVLLSIPKMQTREAIAKKLALPIETVDAVLHFLLANGLCQKDGLNFKISRSQIYLDKSSPFISKHHANWRIKALSAFNRLDDSQLHNSTVVTLSAADYPKVKEIFTQALSDAYDVIKHSPEETVAAICLDVFNL